MKTKKKFPPANFGPESIILCDFDGTITLEDTCEKILQRFVERNWQKYDLALEKGTISLHECMQVQFGMIKADKASIVEFVRPVSLREGFVEFVKFCKTREIPLIIVSAGLDFVIESILNLHRITLPIIAARTSFDNGILLTFPPLHYSDSIDFKADLVRYYKNQQKQVIFIGDGASDLHGALAADVVYSVKEKYLSTQIGIDFSDFSELRDTLRNFREHSKLDILF